eukprot:12827144-Ditylum_brightwellii.AAC.1
MVLSSKKSWEDSSVKESGARSESAFNGSKESIWRLNEHKVGEAVSFCVAWWHGHALNHFIEKKAEF